MCPEILSAAWHARTPPALCCKQPAQDVEGSLGLVAGWVAHDTSYCRQEALCGKAA